MPDTKNIIAQKEPRTLHSAKECFQPQEPATEVVCGLLRQDELSLWYGPGGSKKTYTLYDFGLCVGHGIQCQDFNTIQSPVLIVDEESGDKRIKRRLKELMNAHMITEEHDTPVHWWTLTDFDVSRDEDLEELQKTIIETGAKFVIIDALIDILKYGKDADNSANSMQFIFHSLRKIIEATHCHIAIIDHANRAGSYRGSSAKLGGVNVMVAVSSEKKSDLIEFDIEKMTDGEPFKFAARINFGDGMTSITSTQATEKAERFSKSKRYVLRFLDKGDNLMTEIASHADSCTERAAELAVYALVDSGHVERKDAGGRGDDATYGLTAKGKLAVP